jgi:eukaryotic-like serine/threonine-protein kinase
MAQRLRADGPLDLLGAAPVIRQLADGLNKAHEAGVIHGDLKPGNIFLVDPKRPHSGIRVVITDFGLAVPALDFVAGSRTTLSTLTTAGIRGTPAYMAPELLRGGRATVASDLYAFGVIVYELVTGLHPFAEENVSLQMDAILNGRPRTPSNLKQTLPKSFDAIMLKALQNNPMNRYRSAAELIKELEPVLIDSHLGGQTACSRSDVAGVQPADAPTSMHPERLHWLQPRTGWTLAIGTLVIVTLLIMLLGFAAYYKLDL